MFIYLFTLNGSCLFLGKMDRFHLLMVLRTIPEAAANSIKAL